MKGRTAVQVWVTLVVLASSSTEANEPIFVVSHNMRIVLVPQDVPVGTVLYRLRGTDSDHDYPLTFEVLGDIGVTLVRVENLPCNPKHDYCDADVLLRSPLEEDRSYNFRMRVRDSSGGSTTVPCTIRATPPNSRAAASSPEAFPRAIALLMVPEDTTPGSVIDHVIARNNPNSAVQVTFELRETTRYSGNLTSSFALRAQLLPNNQTKCSIVLNGSLDFERQTVYLLKLYALNSRSIPEEDTRNIAVLDISVVVLDVQDTPPIFIQASPVTQLPSTLQPGDFITQVRAQDGDRGEPRGIRYGLLSDKNPFVGFFDIDRHTGALTLRKALKELAAITRANQPIILTVVAEEVTTTLTDDAPGQASSTVDIALLVDDIGNNPPQFANTEYVARIDEGSAVGTPLLFQDPYDPRVRDDDRGQKAVFSLELDGDEDAFEVSPSVVDGSSSFEIRVKRSEVIDYERVQQLRFRVVAREVFQDSTLSASTNLTVYINDVNDNVPKFTLEQYTCQLLENATAGQKVTQVEAHDLDTGPFGDIRYSMVRGPSSDALMVDPLTGVINVLTSNHGFDREVAAEHRFYVEARDGAGRGEHSATAVVIVQLIDVNDSPPTFRRSLYEGIMAPDLTHLRSKLIVEAYDDDAEGPNSQVRYEIISGNYEWKFQIDQVTGEISLREPLNIQSNRPTRNSSVRRRRQTSTSEAPADIITLNVRAYDLGIPHLSSEVPVQIYTNEVTSRTMKFIIPHTRDWAERNRGLVEETLSTLTGGTARVISVAPFTGKEKGSDLSGSKQSNDQKSVVTATVGFPVDLVVDVERVLHKLDGNSSAAVKEAVEVYRGENKVLLWILIILAILFLLLIICFLLCCLCPWGYCYQERKQSRVYSAEAVRPIKIKLVSDAEGGEVKSSRRGIDRVIEVVREDRSRSPPLLTTSRKEAWSADTRRRYWRFPSASRQRHSSADNTREVASVARTEPNVIYSRRLQNQADESVSLREGLVYVEDYDGTYIPGRIVDPRERSTLVLPWFGT